MVCDRLSVKRYYVDGRFGQIHYRLARPQRSTKLPLICLHMSPYCSVIYENLIRELSSDRICIAMDTPGFGGSDAPDFSPTIGDYALALKDFIDSLDFAEVDLLGYHTGGKIALEVAINFPDLVRKVILVSAAIWPAAQREKLRALYSRSNISHDGSHIVNWWKSAINWSMRGRSLESINKVFWSRTLNPEISWWGHHAAINYSTKIALQKVLHPVLVLNPEDDLWEHTALAKALLTNPKSSVHDLPGWSHGFLDVKTEEVASIVRSFLH
ncbi:MAG: hypothetical protein CMM25_02155 [Rhodospirillaceae bacterium]|nr:hypothetical protein [Rhodospirillaceae bacterium]